ncbi:MAG: hypothetical protein ACKO0N_06205, partial [Planctomycetota bacterium]
MATKTIRVVSREVDGSLRVKDHEGIEALQNCYEQIGIDDCSTDLTLRGFPLFRGLVGPIAEGRRIARYETPYLLRGPFLRQDLEDFRCLIAGNSTTLSNRT